MVGVPNGPRLYSSGHDSEQYAKFGAATIYSRLNGLFGLRRSVLGVAVRSFCQKRVLQSKCTIV